MIATIRVPTSLAPIVLPLPTLYPLRWVALRTSGPPHPLLSLKMPSVLCLLKFQVWQDSKLQPASASATQQIPMVLVLGCFYLSSSVGASLPTTQRCRPTPWGYCIPPFMASPTGLGSSTFQSVHLSASPPMATTSPGPSRSLCRVPSSSPSAERSVSRPSPPASCGGCWRWRGGLRVRSVSLTAPWEAISYSRSLAHT